MGKDRIKTVLITGGSEGIGLELAGLFAKDGYRVVLAARNQKKLEEAAGILKRYGGQIECIPIDLSVTGSGMKLYSLIQEKGIQIDVLVNNAGVGYAGKSIDTAVEADERLVVLNAVTLMTLTKVFCKDMLERNEGEIINISSVAAFQPGPYNNSYYASKAFVQSYTRALKEEIRGSAVRVYAYCPGPVKTGFYKSGGGRMPEHAMTAEQCAAYLYRHRRKGTVIIPSGLQKAALILPSGLKMKVIGSVKKHQWEKKERNDESSSNI